MSIHANSKASLIPAKLTLISSFQVNDAFPLKFASVINVATNASFEETTATIARINSIMAA